MSNTNVAYPVLGVYLILVLGAGILGAVINFRNGADGHHDKVREHFLAGKGLGTFVWFWTMMATLFSGYSVSGIVNEAYSTGWMVTKWIPAGVGLYIAFAVMAPRLHALSKRRGYFTISQVIFDRYMPPSGSSIYVAHILGLLSFACLQLPVFTYLITQFQSIGREVRTFTSGAISATVAINVSAAVLLICDLLGGMRAVAFTDVLQGVVLLCGSIIFLIIQRTELGGLDAAFEFWSNPKIGVFGTRFWTMQHVPTHVNIVAYFDFVFKTTVAATMFPHLTARLFAARSSKVIRHGMSIMVFTFFIVQFSSMVTGWVASAAIPKLPKGSSAFGKLLQIVADRGNGEAFAAALLLAAAICAMMSTADSALLAFSQMWVRDVYTKYLRKRAGQVEQLVFAKLIAVVGLVIGVTVGNYSVERGKPDLSGLFALQNVTPIHVTPAIWLGLHWRGLRGEAVLTGMIVGLGVTLGLVFSDKNISRAVGSDMTTVGISAAWFGFVVNIFLVITLGLLMQHYPGLFGLQPLPPPPAEDDVEEVREDEHGYDTSLLPANSVVDEAAYAAAKGIEQRSATASSTSSAALPDPAASTPFSRFVPRHLEIGIHRDRTLWPPLWALMGIVLLFTVPFYRVPKSWDGYVGHIGSWPFTSLLLGGVLAILGSFTFLYVWEDYKPVREGALPAASDAEARSPGPKTVGCTFVCGCGPEEMVIEPEARPEAPAKAPGGPPAPIEAFAEHPAPKAPPPPPEPQPEPPVEAPAAVPIVMEVEARVVAVEEQAAEAQPPAVEEQATEAQAPAVEEQAAEAQAPAVEEQAAEAQAPAVEEQAAKAQAPAVEEQAAEAQALADEEQARYEAQEDADKQEVAERPAAPVVADEVETLALPFEGRDEETAVTAVTPVTPAEGAAAARAP